jgi:hypothetical protein
MPYKSDAQRRYFHAAEARGEIKKKTVHEFDEASKGRDLPEHVEKWEGGYAYGGKAQSQPQDSDKNKIQPGDSDDVKQQKAAAQASESAGNALVGMFSDGGPVSPEEAAKIARAMGMPQPKPKMMAEGGEVRYDLDEHGMHEYLRDQLHPDMSSEEGSRETDHEESPMPSEGYDREMTVEPSDENGMPDADDTLTRQEMLMELRRRKYGKR